MIEPKKIIILGIGGNCIDILDIINDINASLNEPAYKVAGFLDDNEEKWDTDIHGIKVLGGLNTASQYPDCSFINGIVSPSCFDQKEAIISKTGLEIERFETVIHPTSHISELAKIDKGTVIFQNVTVNSGVQIGIHVLVLPNSVISHDVIVDDYATIASGVCISGSVRVGKSCYLGSKSSIKENVRIGASSLVGIGSVVLGDVPEKSVFAGNPAKLLRSLDKAKKGEE